MPVKGPNIISLHLVLWGKFKADQMPHFDITHTRRSTPLSEMQMKTEGEKC